MVKNENKLNTKNDNVLLLLQYIEELTNQGECYKGSLQKLCKTFELEPSDSKLLPNICIENNILVKSGNIRYPSYTLVPSFIPTLEEAKRILDRCYRKRKSNNERSINKKIMLSKSCQEKIQFNPRKEKMRNGRTIQTTKFLLQNAIHNLIRLGKLRGSLRLYFIRQGVCTNEAQYIASHLIKKHLTTEGNGVHRTYLTPGNFTISLVDVKFVSKVLIEAKRKIDEATEKQRLKKLKQDSLGNSTKGFTFPNPNRVEKAIDDNREMYGSKNLQTNVMGNTIFVGDNDMSFRDEMIGKATERIIMSNYKDQEIEQMSNIYPGKKIRPVSSLKKIIMDNPRDQEIEDRTVAYFNKINFPIIKFVDRLIELMTEIMTPEEIIFDTEHRNKFDAEIREKLNLTSSEVEVDLKTYRGLSLIWDASSKTPIQIK